jgi:hypothetical protein
MNATEFLPTFDTVSSPELQSVLNVIRERILIPGNLNQQQYDLITNAEQRQYLESESVMTSIGDQDVRLRPLNPRTDFVSRSDSFRQALELTSSSTSGTDWSIWPALLHGYSSAGIKLKSHLTRRLVLQALKHGQLTMLMKCLHSARETRITIEEARTRRAFFRAVRDEAERHGWDVEFSQKALRRAMFLNFLMQDDRHGGKALSPVNPTTDPRSDPLAIAVPLEATVRLLKVSSNSQELLNQLPKLAARLLTVIEHVNEDIVSFPFQLRLVFPTNSWFSKTTTFGSTRTLRSQTTRMDKSTATLLKSTGWTTCYYLGYRLLTR